jgi:hypothetical protein
VLLHNFHGGQLAFFEIAATLIPILVFSGVVAERNGPRAEDSHRRTLCVALLIPVIGALAVLAELVSINGIVDGPISASAVGFVAACVASGLVAVILSVWLPWLSALRGRMPERYALVLKASIVLLSAVAGGTVIVVVQAVGAAHSIEQHESEVRSCEHRTEKAATEFRRSLSEFSANAIQRRTDERAESKAKELLYRAEDDKEPSRLLNVAKERVKEEREALGGDLKRGRRLAERAVSPSRWLRIQRLRCSGGFLNAVAAAVLEASDSPLSQGR